MGLINTLIYIINNAGCCGEILLWLMASPSNGQHNSLQYSYKAEDHYLFQMILSFNILANCQKMKQWN